MKVFILLCLLTLAVSENLEKLENKGKRTPLLWYIIERLLNLSANVNELKNKQNQIGTELGNTKRIIANRKIIVDNQFSSLKKQSKCQSGVDGQHLHNLTWPYYKYIRFNPPFSATPSFVYGFSLLDAWQGKNVRAKVVIRHLTRTGVSIYLHKWGDTVMYGMRISWMACPK